jgi:hypothetical protein
MIFQKKIKLQFETDEKVSQKPNPFRGWFSIFPFRLPEPADFKELSYCLQPAETLVLVKLCIENFADRPLDAAACEQIDMIFDFFVQHDITMIVRFSYDDSGSGLTKEPASIETIKQHMRQTGPILAKYHEHILTTQGLFIGSWGEMHTSRYLGSKELTELAVCFYKACEGKLSLSVRKPSQLRMIMSELRRFYKKYEVVPVLAEAIIKSIGLYNDALLASETDYGTYADLAIFENDFTKSWTLAKELEFQRELCKGALNGGETVNDNPLNDGQSAISRFREIKITYLNSQYDKAVLDKWKNEYISYDYENQSIYDYIGSHLGYCVCVKKAFLDRKNKNALHVILKNEGFAPLYRKTRLKLTLTGSSSSVCIYSAPQRQLPENCETDISCMLENLSPDTYKLCACLEDILTKKEICFYNTDTIGALTIVK